MNSKPELKYYPCIWKDRKITKTVLTASVLTKFQNMQLPNISLLHYITILFSKKGKIF
jgi:hypothetical protein